MPTAFDSSDFSDRADDALDEPTDAFAFLRGEHQAVDGLFDDFAAAVQSGDDDARRQLAEQICAALTAHASIEEEIFYPALRSVLDDDSVLNEAAIEHASTSALIEQIETSDPDHELFNAMVIVLGDYVRLHVRKEEDEIFPLAEDAGIDPMQLGAAMLQRKRELGGDDPSLGVDC